MVDWNIYNGKNEEWDELLSSLPFFSLYQSYQWGETKKKDGWETYRFISRFPKLSMAQVFLKRLPMNGAFFWCPGGIQGYSTTIELQKFKNEVGFYYHYFRCSFHDPNLSVPDLLENGWRKVSFSLNCNQSMNIFLSDSEDEILRNMSSNWRHNLKRFYKKDISVEVWSNPDPDKLYGYYVEFESLKKLPPQHSRESIRGVIKNFKDKLVILKAIDKEGALLALRGYIYLGNRALDWYAISTERGRACYASNGITWEVLRDAKSRGVVYYDFSGVDPVNNLGVYNFKKGTGANLVSYPGEFETSNPSFLSHGINFLMKLKFSGN